MKSIKSIWQITLLFLIVFSSGCTQISLQKTTKSNLLYNADTKHATVKPIVMVLIYGRAPAIGWEKENIDTILDG
jgi:hypothetical protein